MSAERPDEEEYDVSCITRMPTLDSYKPGLDNVMTNPVFNPVDVGLDADFQLTKYNRLKG